MTVTLTGSGGVSRDYPVVTDHSGYYTLTLTTAGPGAYNWRCKNPQTLATAGAAVLVGGTNNVDMGTLRAGDANNDNIVNSADFSILRNTFGIGIGGQGYDARADFNGDSVVNSTDFNLLKSNFGQAGAPPTNP